MIYFYMKGNLRVVFGYLVGLYNVGQYVHCKWNHICCSNHGNSNHVTDLLMSFLFLFIELKLYIEENIQCNVIVLLIIWRQILEIIFVKKKFPYTYCIYNVC